MTIPRRNLMKLGAATIAGAGISACATSTASAPVKPAFVLIHGAWHGAWTYQKVIPELSALGHTAVAVDLPGHGLDARFPASYFPRPLDAAAFASEVSPLASITVEQCADSVIAAIDQLRVGGFGKIVLVGHSLGGVTITRVAERAPESLQKLVYLSAFMLPAGKSSRDVAQWPEGAGAQVFPLLKGNPAAIRASRIDFMSTDPAYLAQAKLAFYGDVSDDQFRAVSNLLTPDEPAAMGLTPADKTVARWGSVSRHYISCLQDRAIMPAMQRRFIAEADEFAPATRTVVHTMNTSHSPFVSAPKDLAGLLSRIALS